MCHLLKRGDDHETETSLPRPASMHSAFRTFASLGLMTVTV
jgi:hypothetical protein